MKTFKSLCCVMCASLSMQVAAQSQPLPYQDPSLTAEQRAEDLLKRLTLEEKTQLLMDTSPAIPRLGIPQFQWWNEALHGVGRNGFATVFPITMQMAATWDDDLVEHIFTAVSDEARAKAQQAKQQGKIQRYQSLSFWTPNINIFRDPRWGRGQETYGEDPWLTARMGVAVVRGLQGTSHHDTMSASDAEGARKYRKLLACAKHFAVHSGPEWNRHTFNIESLPERDLWETYLPAFKALVQEAEVAEVMCAYQRIDGQPCCAQHRYEQQILRDEWGFQGLITSDCGAIRDFLPQWHNVARDNEEAAAKAVRNGTDVECGSVYKNLPAAVKRGDISEADIDRSLRRLLKSRFELGDMDDDRLVAWTRIPASVIACRDHKQLALQAAREGIVLLQNNGILPLANAPVAVMGPNANDSIMMWGNYAGYPTRTVTILQGLREALGQDIKYIQGCGLTRSETFESRWSQLTAPLGSPGMQAAYWNNEEMKGNPITTVTHTSSISLNNGGNTVFAPGVPLEHFSARYDATLNPTADETLILRLSVDDKVRLLVNGDTLINNWRERNRMYETQKELKVKAGHSYRIQIDYVQATGFAAMQFDVLKRSTPTPQELLRQLGDTETVIFVGGISPRVEGEEMKVSEPGFKGGDRTSIELPQVQRDLIRLLKQSGKRVVLLCCSGSAVALTPESELCDAIVQVWYGGEQGGKAVAEVLTGQVNPSGKLPMTVYRDDSQLPDFLDYRMKGRTYRYFEGRPLWPFGHGLSYTTFQLGKPQYKNGEVRLTVQNTGKREGTEVVQVYIRRPADKEGPLKTLRGYCRVTLQPGEKRTVAIAMPRERFENWDAQTNTMRVVPGQYELMVGNSSADSNLQKLSVNIR